MRRIAYFSGVVSLCLGLVGCTQPFATTGWNFSVGRPATLVAPAAVAQGSASMALYPVAVTAAAPAQGMALAATAPLAGCAPCQPCAPGSALPPPRPLP